MTQRQAIENFVVASGEEFDADDLDTIERDIGDPSSPLPITKTHESIDDFRKSGWIDDGDCDGLATFVKPGREKSGPWLFIADMGDYRLCYVQR